jgi:hypothetical protein
MQDTVKLSVTEAELDSATSNVQDMLHVKNIMESLGLKVKLPMILKQGVRNIVNGWSVGCQTRHAATKQMFLWELKDTKKLSGPVFCKHTPHYIGEVKELDT